MKLKRGQKIYGWNNLNKDESEILEAEIEDVRMFSIIDEVTGELVCTKTVYLAYNNSRWFTTFNEAKKAYIDTLMGQIQWRQKLLDEVKKVKSLTC